MFSEGLPKHPRISVRLLMLFVGLAVLMWVSWTMNGSLFPADNAQANIFQSGLLLVVLGSTFLEDKFTKPADAVINALTATIALLTVHPSHSGMTWFYMLGYCVVVFTIGAASIALGLPGAAVGPRAVVGNALYVLSTTLGKANVIFSLVFLYAVAAFYGTGSRETGTLVLFWGVWVALWPLKIPHLIDALLSVKRAPKACGTILRVDSPNLIMVKLEPDAQWTDERALVACLGDGSQRSVMPLYKEVQNEQVVGVGLLLDSTPAPLNLAHHGGIYVPASDAEGVPAACAGDEDLGPIGLCREGSTIGRLQFDTWRPEGCREGLLVYCNIDGQQVYYQIIDAATREEEFQHHKHGFMVVQAAQLGTLGPARGFLKYGWLPAMNTPVFLATNVSAHRAKSTSDFVFGHVPGSNVEVVGDINEMISHHTAILGVTGSGKTELAYDIIQKAIDNGVRVFCVDLTGDYADRLSRFDPQMLSIEEETSEELGAALFAVETGEFKAAKERLALNQLAERLYGDVYSAVSAFLTGDRSLGVFGLPSISNTKATIFVTELYLSSIFRYAREHRGERNILVVLEEAHTVIPEAKTMGLGDFESQGMVARIAQIALQGRKYGVGLLIIAQRTATVSKTVLSQCNTIIAFSSFDQTGLEYLANFFGADHASKLPNLRFLEALVFGKGVRSQRPVVVRIPDKPCGAEAKREPA